MLWDLRLTSRHRLRPLRGRLPYWEPLEFELPPVGSGRPDPWRRWIDTALDSPHDIVPWRTAPSTPGALYRTEARSVVVLFADLG